MKECVEKFGGAFIGPFEHCQVGCPCVCSEGHICYPALQSLRRGHGMCRACAGKDPEVAKQEFMLDLKEMRAELISPYGRRLPDRVKIRCRNGHECWTTPFNFKKSKSCPDCTQSAGENALGKLLDELKVQVIPQYRIGDSLKRYDFGNKKIVFEYDGAQHFQDIPLFSTGLTFAERRAIDYQKTKLALETCHRVIRIHYFWLQHKQDSKLAFLRAALASPAPFVVSKLDAYDWLEDLGPIALQYK